MEQHLHTVILFHLVRTFIVYKAMPGLKYWRELFKAFEPL